MPSFLESCEEYFGTNDLYKLLQIEKTSSQKEVQKAYRKLSLLVHPDRVSDEDKENATEKFKILGKAYSVLSDSEKRAVYDETGCVDEEDGGLNGRDWMEYWRSIFKEVTFDDISNYENEYIGSEEEKKDLLTAYVNGKGSMDYIYECVPFTTPDNEDRIRNIIQEAINKKEVKAFSAFTNETPSKKEARKRKWEKEAKAAAKAREEILGKKSKNRSTLAESPSVLEMAAAAIRKRQAEREATVESFLQDLESKYCKPKAKAGKKKK